MPVKVSVADLTVAMSNVAPLTEKPVASVVTTELRSPLSEPPAPTNRLAPRSEEHTSELQSRFELVCRLLLEKKKKQDLIAPHHSPPPPLPVTAPALWLLLVGFCFTASTLEPRAQRWLWSVPSQPVLALSASP